MSSSRLSRLVSRIGVTGIGAAAALAALAGCVAPAPVAPLAAITAGDARVWFYRNRENPDLPALPEIAMNGQVIGRSIEGGSFYRDVPPGIYHVTVDSYGRDSYQSQNIGLVAGQQVYVQIQSLPSWEASGLHFDRNTFYVVLVSPAVAAFDLAQTSFYGGG